MRPAFGQRLWLFLLVLLMFCFHAEAFGQAAAANAKTLGGVNVPGVAFTYGITLDQAKKPAPPLYVPLRHYMTANRDPAAEPDNNKDGCDKIGDPILPKTGAKTGIFPLFAMPGEMGLSYTLYYNTALTQNLRTSPWHDNWGYSLDVNCDLAGGASPCPYTTAFRPDGSTIRFQGSRFATTYTQMSGNTVVRLTRDSTTGVYTLQDEDQTTSTYDANGVILTRKNLSGIGWRFSRSGNTTTITHTNGQSISISTASGGTVTVTDPGNNAYVVKWGPQFEPTAYFGDVASIAMPGLPATVIGFKYHPNFPKLLTEVDYNGAPHAYTTYFTSDSKSPFYLWATGESLVDGSGRNSLQYSKDFAGNLQVVATNPLGHQSTRTYNLITLPNKGQYLSDVNTISDDAVQTCGATVRGHSYDDNANLAATIDNNSNVHTFNYALNGQLQSETEASGTPIARTTNYVWDPNEQLNRKLSATVVGWQKTAYTYTAENRLASVAVTNLSGQGVANQTLTTTNRYTLYGNGMIHTVAVTKPSPNGSDTSTYKYDPSGNLTSFTNGLGQTTSYSNYNALGEVGHVVGPNGDTTDYTYDARGRISTKTTYPNGTAATWTYTYDGFGLPHTESGPDGQVTTWSRDATMRVQTITHNDKDGASTESFSYDANGNVLDHKIVRGGTVGLHEVFHYDALGRVYQKVGQNGQLLTYAYDGNGNVLSVADAVGHTVSYQYDALNRVTRKTESGGASPVIPAAAPTINAPSSNTTGAYSVSWNSVTGATSYELQAQVNGGGWSTIQYTSALSWAASAKPNGTYGYRVHGCNATGCSPWSGVVSTTVLLPPPTPTNVSGPATSSGSIPLTWDVSPTATSYDVHQSFNNGTWTLVQSVTKNAATITARTSGNYQFFITANNASGWSGQVGASNVVVVTIPPAAAPTITVPSNNATGSYAISWTSVAGATSYTLQERVNGGAWSTVQSTGATSWNAAAKSNGTYVYQVRACNAGGCSAWSATGTTTVLLPPGSPPSVSSPGTNSSGSYTVSWSTITSATSYALQEQVNGGTWTTVQSTAATSWAASGKANGTYGYRAQSCNGGGCSAWSAVSATTVLHPPGSAPALTVPSSSSTGSYAVSWTGVATAATYNLREQVNGGTWTTVQSSSAVSWSANAHGNATYGYQVQACNSGGCGPWSAVGSTTVRLLPGSAPSISAPANSTNGSFTVSWSVVTTATSYKLQEQVNGGAWSTVQSNASTSRGTSGRGNGTYGYHVQACNSSGCGPWSGVANTSVLWPPTGAPALSVPARNYSGSYTVSWSGVSTASSYTLQEQVNGGAWSTVQANGNTTWSTSGRGNGTYGYQVIACNASGCGPWSGSASVLEIIPAPIAINSKGYSVYYGIPARKTGSDSIGFSIVGGNTWQVVTNKPGQLGYVAASGAVPSMAVSVQFTYTSLGPPSGATDAGGTLTNGASSPVAISSNPTSLYATGTFSGGTTHGRTYSLRVNFYDSTGTNISSSTCTLTAETGTAL